MGTPLPEPSDITGEDLLEAVANQDALIAEWRAKVAALDAQVAEMRAKAAKTDDEFARFKERMNQSSLRTIKRSEKS